MLKINLLNAYETGDAIGKFLTGFFLIAMLLIVIFVMYRYLGTKKS